MTQQMKNESNRSEFYVIDGKLLVILITEASE
jgi:hypothetical protein